MSITPESMQYILGIHPSQIAAEQSFVNAAQGQGQQQGDDQSQAPDQTQPGQAPSLGMPSASPDQSSKIADETNQEADVRRDDGTPAHLVRIGTGPNGAPKLGLPPVKAPDAAPSSGTASGTASGAPGTGSPTVSKPSSYNPLTDPVRQEINQDQEREAKDRAEAERLQKTGSGVKQFQAKHHILGPIIRGLDIAGSVLAPGTAAMIPGTTMHHNLLVHQQEGKIAQDEKDQAAHFNMFDRIEANRMRDERDQQMAEKFVAGTEREDANSPTGYVAQTVGGEFKPYTPPQTYKQTAGEKFNDEVTERTKEADRLHLTGTKREAFIANGKVPEPGVNIHVPSAEKEHYDDVKQAFKQQYGHYPQSTDDFDTFNRMLKGERGGGDRPPHAKDRVTFEGYWAKRLGPGSAVEKKYDGERNAVLKVYGADKDPKAYSDNKDDIEAKFKQIEADREAEKAALQQEKDAEAEEYGIYDQHPRGAVPVSGQQPGSSQGIPKPQFNVRTGQPVQPKPSPGTAEKLNPMPDKEVKTPGGHTVKIGDKNPRTGQTVKGFARNAKGEIVATY